MEAREKIRILLVDDHHVVREGLRSYLRRHSQFDVIGEAGDGKEAVSMARKLRPDVMLLDVNLPLINGFAATELIHGESPQIRILVLSVHKNPEYVRKIMKLGARGYILKDASPVEVIHGIETVSHGGIFFCSRTENALLGDLKGGSPFWPGSQSLLSNREREILKQIADGKTSKDIALSLKIGVRTVQTHRERIMRKLNIHSVAGLTRYAINTLDLSDPTP